MPRGRSDASWRTNSIKAGSNDISATGPCVACEHINGASGQSRIAIKTAFELKQQGDPSGNEIAQFLKRKDAPGAAFEANRLDLSGAHLSEKPAAFRQAAECIVVVHHGFAVRTDLEIGLNSVTGGDCC